MKAGDKYRLTTSIYDDGEDHHPSGYIGLKGDLVVVRKIKYSKKGYQWIYVSHEHVTDKAFLVYHHELKSI